MTRNGDQSQTDWKSIVTWAKWINVNIFYSSLAQGYVCLIPTGPTHKDAQRKGKMKMRCKQCLVGPQNTLYYLFANPIGIGLCLFLLLLLVVYDGQMCNDEGMWSYIGRIWSQNGIPPYSGAIENKTPGIFELYAISNILFGVNVFFVRGIGILSILLSSLIVYLIGKELHSHLSGIFSMIIFGLTMTWKLLDGVFTSQPETFMVLFSTLSFYFIIKVLKYREWKCWIILAGLSMGIAIAFKQIALTTTLALIFFFLVYTAKNFSGKNTLIGLILLALGIIISTLFSLIPLLVSDVSLSEYIKGAWLILLIKGYISSVAIVARTGEFFDIWLNSRITILYPFLALLIFQYNLARNRYFIGLLGWMFFDFVGVIAAPMYWGHQIKQVIPSVSIVIGILLSNLLANHISDNALKSKYTRILAMVLIILLFPYESLVSNLHKAVSGYSNINREIGIWLKDNTNEKDYVYILARNGNVILSYSERIASSKYFNTIFIRPYDESRNVLLSDLKAKPPLYLLKSVPSIDIGEEINDFIKNNYTFLYAKHEYEFFKRKLL